MKNFIEDLNWWNKYKRKKESKKEIMFGLVRFYGISTIGGYLIPNPVLYISSSISNNSVSRKYSFFAYTQLNVKTVLFQTIQLNISTQLKCEKQFYSKQFSLA